MAAQYAPALRRKLQEAGLQGCLDAGAFRRMLDYVDEVDGSLDLVHRLIDAIKPDLDEGGTISQAMVDTAIAQLQGREQARDLVFVVSAFDVPRIVYDTVTKRLHADDTPTSMMPPAEAKQRLYLNRLLLLYQRLRRNERFQPPNPVQSRGGGGSAPHLQVQLTEAMGLKAAVGQVRLVLGMLSSDEDGRLTLEDAGGSVQLDIEGARVSSGYITENCVVVAEGEMGADGVFRVIALGFPSCEPRSKLPMTAQKLNFFGAPMLNDDEAAQAELAEAERVEDRLVFLANVALDSPATLDALNTLFLGFEEADMIPPMFVLMGDFLASSAAVAAGAAAGGGGAHATQGHTGYGGSGMTAFGGGPASGGADYVALKDGFANLAALIARYPKIKEGSRFVFVPGPNDPGLGQVLPQPALPSYFTSELRQVLPNAVFATNPCRIKYYTREIVVFRHDVARHMRRRCLVPPTDLGADDGDLSFTHLALTLLQQSHLCPLPLVVQPVHWAHDAALQLYPLPHALVLAGGGGQAQFVHEGCTVFDPGCLREGLFSAFVPFQDEVEPSELPQEGGD